MEVSGDQTNRFRFWRRVCLYAVAAYGVLVAASGAAALGSLRALATSASLDIVCGPLTLLSVHKDALASGGFELEVGFRSGMLWLLLCCLAVAIGTGLICRRGRAPRRA